MEQELLIDKLVGLVREKDQPEIRSRIELGMSRNAGGDAARALRFLTDLDILVHLRGPDFMYARGIAETLRVGEDIFELSYAVKKLMV